MRIAKNDIRGQLLQLPEENFEHLDDFLAQMQLYNAGIREMRTKLEILDEEFETKFDHNPIHHIESRLKKPQSIFEKLHRRGLPVTMESIRENLSDVAGIRVICNYIDDVYRIAEMLSRQDDVRVITVHDYIKEQKESGYRSLHMVVEIPIFLSERTVDVRVEVQIRTIAMDFWASLEHALKYKTDKNVPEDLFTRLRICAEAIAEVDAEMQAIHEEITNT